MHAKDLIKENNEKRELLNEENQEDYEEMLVYIRMHNKSEQQSEEILMELLDHLLEAQANGKTAKDIFGEDLKAYSEDLINELPRETKKDQLILLLYLGLNLLGIVAIFTGIANYLAYKIFGLGTATFDFYLGTGISIVIIDLILLAGFVYIVILWINGSVFKKKPTKKWMEFLQVWVIAMVFIGLTLLVFMFMPTFGSLISTSHLLIVGVGLILYLASVVMNKRLRITK
ncbi:DUF1129 family protein [Oceanobacillus sp. CAU 1775]